MSEEFTSYGEIDEEDVDRIAEDGWKTQRRVMKVTKMIKTKSSSCS